MGRRKCKQSRTPSVFLPSSCGLRAPSAAQEVFEALLEAAFEQKAERSGQRGAGACDERDRAAGWQARIVGEPQQKAAAYLVDEVKRICQQPKHAGHRTRPRA